MGESDWIGPPLTWGEDGKLIPLTQEELERQTAVAKEAAAANPPLPENRRLSRRESLRLVWRDVAELLDQMFSAEKIVAGVSYVLSSGVVAALIAKMWPVFLGLGLSLGLFRLWVLYRLAD